jgi:hypothetical protein
VVDFKQDLLDREAKLAMGMVLPELDNDDFKEPLPMKK